jgi:hypothetical protein
VQAVGLWITPLCYDQQTSDSLRMLQVSSHMLNMKLVYVSLLLWTVVCEKFHSACTAVFPNKSGG